MPATAQERPLARFALMCSNFAERWFPDAWVFAALAVLVVALGAMAMGGSPAATAGAFGDGFWSLIPFTLQMAFVVIAGYVVASSPPAAALIARLARLPRSGRSAVAWVALAAGWLFREFSSKPAIIAISGLNTYNFLFLMLGALLHWRPRSFLDAVARAVPSTTGVLIQFPLYGSIAAILTTVKGGDGQALAHHIATAFTQVATHDTYAVLMGLYSAVLGFFIPSGGGKWIIEAPYVMQVAHDLQYHMGWAVQIYNAAEALPNLINPFYMLPLLGVLGLRARDLIGFCFVQLLLHAPLVLLLLWLLGTTLAWAPPVLPGAGAGG